jgi:NADH dehydrogenase
LAQLAPGCQPAVFPAPAGSLRIIRRMSTPLPTAPASGRPHVLVIGCGFGGLEAARKLQQADVDITIVDKTNHHLFQPLL